MSKEHEDTEPKIDRRKVGYVLIGFAVVLVVGIIIMKKLGLT